MWNIVETLRKKNSQSYLLKVVKHFSGKELQTANYIMYADDVPIGKQKDIEWIANESIRTAKEWLKIRCLQLATHKTGAALISTRRENGICISS